MIISNHFIYHQQYYICILAVLIYFLCCTFSDFCSQTIFFILFRSPNLETGYNFIYLCLSYYATFFIFLLMKFLLRKLRKLKSHSILFLNKKKLFFILFSSNQILLLNYISLCFSTLKSSAFNINFYFSISLIIISIFIIFIIFSNLYLLHNHMEKSLQKTRLFILEKEMLKELNHYESINYILSDIRKIRHDFNNQLQTAYILAKKNNATPQPAQEQVEQVISFEKSVSFCENIIVNFIIQSISKQSIDSGIAFHTKLNLPLDINIENADLCSIFFNLLTNALSAAQNSINPRITLDASYQNNILKIILYNTMGESSKQYKDPRLHGYGLLILNDIAAKYHGTFKTSENNGIFSAYFYITSRE